MDTAKIKYVHVVALREKGLSQEDYKARLLAITGKDTCKNLNRKEYNQLMASLYRLPNARRNLPKRAQTTT